LKRASAAKAAAASAASVAKIANVRQLICRSVLEGGESIQPIYVSTAVSTPCERIGFMTPERLAVADREAERSGRTLGSEDVHVEPGGR